LEADGGSKSQTESTTSLKFCSNTVYRLPRLPSYFFSSFLIFFSAFFSFGVFAGSFLEVFLLSWPLLMISSPYHRGYEHASHGLHYSTYWRRGRFNYCAGGPSFHQLILRTLKNRPLILFPPRQERAWATLARLIAT